MSKCIHDDLVPANSCAYDDTNPRSVCMQVNQIRAAAAAAALVVVVVVVVVLLLLCFHAYRMHQTGMATSRRR